MNINEVMTSSPQTVGVGATIGEALAVLRELDVRHVPVVDDGDTLVGMVSDRDLSYDGPLASDDYENSAWSSWLDQKVADLMNSDVLSANATDGVEVVIDLMIEHRIGAVPVLDSWERLVGIVSYVDLLRLLKARLP